MTTQRRRRNKQQQASEILERLLHQQESEAAKRKAKYAQAEAAVEHTRRALELLETGTVKGFQPLLAWDPMKIYTAIPLIGEGGSGDDLVVAEAEALAIQQGKKARGIDDVWNPKDAKEGSVTVHTALMYARQESCELCRAGVPFTSRERLEHHVIIRDTDGVECGWEYGPCKGTA